MNPEDALRLHICSAAHPRYMRHPLHASGDWLEGPEVGPPATLKVPWRMGPLVAPMCVACSGRGWKAIIWIMGISQILSGLSPSIAPRPITYFGAQEYINKSAAPQIPFQSKLVSATLVDVLRVGLASSVPRCVSNDAVHAATNAEAVKANAYDRVQHHLATKSVNKIPRHEHDKQQQKDNNEEYQNFDRTDWSCKVNIKVSHFVDKFQEVFRFIPSH